jgi:hypothetical protein
MVRRKLRHIELISARDANGEFVETLASNGKIEVSHGARVD